jgi:hypothetical protein
LCNEWLTLSIPNVDAEAAFSCSVITISLCVRRNCFIVVMFINCLLSQEILILCPNRNRPAPMPTTTRKIYSTRAMRRLECNTHKNQTSACFGFWMDVVITSFKEPHVSKPKIQRTLVGRKLVYVRKWQLRCQSIASQLSPTGALCRTWDSF